MDEINALRVQIAELRTALEAERAFKRWVATLLTVDCAQPLTHKEQSVLDDRVM